ncbi:MAG: hypothetical protein RIN55_09230 [Tissierellaceae bacterium]|nr:hypothetical protein [Tissierellaceae bacterium]
MKKFICSILTVILMLSLFVPASYAAKWEPHEIVTEVERTNNEIERLVEQAIQEVEKLDSSTEKAEKEINKIINNLVKDTNRLADKMIKEAGKIGIEVECEYIEYEIGGQKVLIDPLRVIAF